MTRWVYCSLRLQLHFSGVNTVSCRVMNFKLFSSWQPMFIQKFLQNNIQVMYVIIFNEFFWLADWLFISQFWRCKWSVYSSHMCGHIYLGIQKNVNATIGVLYIFFKHMEKISRMLTEMNSWKLLEIITLLPFQ